MFPKETMRTKIVDNSPYYNKSLITSEGKTMADKLNFEAGCLVHIFRYSVCTSAFISKEYAFYMSVFSTCS